MKQRRSSTRAAVLPILLLSAPALFSWGGDGHEITARIAALHLTASARQMVFDLLKSDPDTKGKLKRKSADDVEAVAAAMAQAATWPDRVKKKSQGKGTGDWHFIDLASDEGATAIGLRCGSSGDCVTVRMTRMLANIPAKEKMSTDFNTYTPAEQLKFLIHFAGDIHQPLHCATNADAGGNCVNTKGFRSSELHAVWDTGMVSPLRADGNAAAAKTMDTEFAERFGDWSGLTDVEQIALESHGIAFDVAYAPLLSMLPAPEPRPFKHVVPSACEADFKNLAAIDVTGLYDGTTKKAVREQLTKGGYRLAAMLNAMAQ